MGRNKVFPLQRYLSNSKVNTGQKNCDASNVGLPDIFWRPHGRNNIELGMVIRFWSQSLESVNIGANLTE